MNPLPSEWVDKAEGDFETTHRELRARRRPNYDAACFHAQQCAEKYLKALLQKRDTEFPRTHNLVALLDLVLPTDPALADLRPSLEYLNLFSVAVRYPGDSADREDAKETAAHCRIVRDRARFALGLES